jgi:hypothetical protein
LGGGGAGPAKLSWAQGCKIPNYGPAYTFPKIHHRQATQGALFMFITTTKISSTIIKIRHLYQIKQKYLNEEQDQVN